MAQLDIYEGTPRELAPFLAQHPDRRFRLIEMAEVEKETASMQNASVLDEKAKAAIALLDSWIADGEAADEQARSEAAQEVEDFKRSMNTNRANLGEGLVYP